MTKYVFIASDESRNISYEVNPTLDGELDTYTDVVDHFFTFLSGVYGYEIGNKYQLKSRNSTKLPPITEKGDW